MWGSGGGSVNSISQTCVWVHFVVNPSPSLRDLCLGASVHLVPLLVILHGISCTECMWPFLYFLENRFFLRSFLFFSFVQ